MVASNIHLPGELLEHICRKLQLTGCQDYRSQSEDLINLSALHSLSLTSKTWNYAATEGLYATLDVENLDGRWLPDKMGCNRIVRPSVLPRLICTILGRPGIRRFVRHVRLPKLHISFHRKPISLRSAALSSQMVEAAANIEISSTLRDRLAEDIGRGTVDAAAVLLLSICPNIATLGMVVTYNKFEGSLMAAVLSEAAAHSPNATSGAFMGSPRSSPLLASLTTLDLVYWDTENSADLQTFVLLLQLPALKIIRCNQISCDRETTLPDIPSRIEEMYLENAPMDMIGLERLLVFCPSLRSLDIRFADASAGENAIDYAELAAAICRHGLNLRSLSIDVEEVFDDDIADTTLGSLQSLPHLVRLTVPFEALFHAPRFNELTRERGAIPGCELEHLPASLEQLEIQKPLDFQPHLASMDAFLAGYVRDTKQKNLWQICVRREAPFSLDLLPQGWSVVSDAENTFVLARDGKAGANETPLPLCERMPSFVSK